MNVGYCTNLPVNCSKAANRDPIPMAGEDARCPECGSALLAGQGPRRPDHAKRIFGALVAVALLAAIGLGVARFAGSGETAPAAANYLLRLSGSNTIGGALAPALVEDWLRSEGATDITREKRSRDGAPLPETVVKARLEGRAVAVEIRAHGSQEAFAHLRDGSADIGMASRPIKAEEAKDLAALGNMTGPDNEHVIALDGIAVIVAPGNGLRSISRQDLARVFSGELSDWSQLGGATGAIHILARDDRSGTYDTFRSLVLGGGKLAAGARRLEDSAALEAEVARDPGAIGFVGLPYVRTARALAVSDGAGAMALSPTVFTVKKEDYPLSRRLFLYTAANPAKSEVRRFILHVQSDKGQKAVRNAGFVDQNIPPPSEVRSDSASGAEGRSCVLGREWPGNRSAYCTLIAGKSDMGTNFRFRAGSSELDNRAVQDLQRVLRALSNAPTQRLILVGFADGQGHYDSNLALSRERAGAVRAALGTLGIHDVEVHAFGEEIPVADNAVPAGRDRNRRVEVWLD